MYADESVVYNNTSGNLGFDFAGSTGRIYDGNKPITEVGEGELRIDKGIINIERYNTDGRYELYLRKYMLGARENEVIPKDTTEDKPRRFRVACEARSIDDGEHNLRFVMRDREKKKWIGKSVLHRICSPEWRRIEAHFTVPPLIEAELRIDDEGVSMAPSTVQIRKLMMTQRRS